MPTRRRTLVLILAAAVAASAQTKIKPGFNLFSKQQDVELGKEAAAEISKQVTVIKDQQLDAYLNRIGKRLAETPEADGQSFPYSFSLVHDKSINAFALPGGPTFVHTGLILSAENEAQVAGVMAHEIAHVALRHGTNQASKSMGVQLLAGLLGQGLGGGSVLKELGKMGIAFGANSVLLKYSRTAENQADLLGARMMARAGYNPIEMARFFEKLEAEGGSRMPQFLSSHPNPGNRVKSVEKEIRSIKGSNFSNDLTGQFSPIQVRIRALGEPPAPKKAAAAK